MSRKNDCLKEIVKTLGGTVSADDNTVCELLSKLNEVLTDKYDCGEVYITNIRTQSNSFILNKILDDGVYSLNFFDNDGSVIDIRGAIFVISKGASTFITFDTMNAAVLRCYIMTNGSYNASDMAFVGLNPDDFPYGSIADYPNPEDYTLVIKKLG